LSVPGIYDGVERATQVKVRALDGKGQSLVIEAEGCWRCVCSTKWTTCWARFLWNTSRL